LARLTLRWRLFGLTLADIDPAAVAAYNDPMGALIDSLGITGKINESVTAATSPINEQLSNLNFATSEDVANAVSGANYATKDDIVNALADLNYTTPEYMMDALEGLNFATPQDITDSLAVAGYATTDELANAIAGLESISLAESPAEAPPQTAFPVTPEVTTLAVTSPVVGEVNSGTSC
jgi:hypothetical protein